MRTAREPMRTAAERKEYPNGGGFGEQKGQSTETRQLRGNRELLQKQYSFKFVR